MNHDWLLVETLGSEPAVVAQGRQTKNLVPISVFLRRNPHLMAVQTAIGETVRLGHGLTSITPKHDRVIRTEVVQMTDGRIHGVHVWVGPPDLEPPQRPVPGPLVWDLATGVATDTTESLANSGLDVARERTHGRAFAEDLPHHDHNPQEAHVLSMAIKPEPGRAFCSTWEVSDHQGEPINVGFVARVLAEEGDNGGERLVCRAMNWRGVREGGPRMAVDDLAQRILDGLAQTGVHRALVDLADWRLLKWLDEPAEFYDWRAHQSGGGSVHPDDADQQARMTTEFAGGTTAGVLRLPACGGGWTPVHVTINRVELDADTYAGLVSLRRPTEDELTAAGLPAEQAPPAEPETGPKNGGSSSRLRRRRSKVSDR